MMMLRAMVVGVVVLGVGACTEFGTDSPSIGGRYDLASVTGSAVPCCTTTDSTGTRITIVGGSLTLANAAPEKFAATPGGYVPSICVQQVPNGAHIDTANVVTLPDGSTYRLPTCEEQHHASYMMIVTRQYEDVAGGSRTAADTTSGVYAWSASHPAMVSLIGSGLGGPVAISAGGVDVTIFALNFGRGPDQGELQYGFSRVSR